MYEDAEFRIFQKNGQLKKHLDNLHSHLSSKLREFFANLETSVKRQRLNSNLFGTVGTFTFDLDAQTVKWIVDPFKCEIAMIPEELSGLVEAIFEFRSNIKARIQFESKPNLSSFWMSKAAKAFIKCI
ncbi:hypothetical protein QYM36_008536 [Artemia franciscana]|uniref:Uncharacterized protein n=1 Tax=Artemia franciscana TaxID=6661 RepID=A0AA88IG59_ARTSF|nr:hypothetical protein QYM36_008536 [Artemia franciscana]